MVQTKTTTASRTTIGIIFLILIFSIPSLAAKLTTTQMRENTIRINALEIENYNIQESPTQEVTVILDAKGLNFDTNKSEIKPEYFKRLEALKKFITENDLEVSIIGFTDSTGNPDYNLALSLKRAESVRNKLVELGLDPNRIVSISGDGASNPISSNNTIEGKLQNRRVEFKLIQKK